MAWTSLSVFLVLALGFLTTTSAQGNATLGLQHGFLTFDTPSFSVKLVKDSQTLASLTPKPAFSNNPAFDFVPFDQLSLRQFNGNYHVGDVTFRVRTVGSSAWISGDTSVARKPVSPLATNSTTLAAANLAATLPANSLLNITRLWTVEDSYLRLLFEVQNVHSTAVEIGSFGIPQEWNNIFTGRTAANVNENCSLFDPYIGLDAGYVQVTPLIGTAGALVITPVGETRFEGWRFLPESTNNTPFYQSQTFEGLYEWQAHTLAYAQNEWAGVTPWNPPSSTILAPGATRTYGLQFNLASSIRGIETTVRGAGLPVAVGIPGYILAQDQVGKLFLNYSSPVAKITVDPPGALSWKNNNDSSSTSITGLDISPSIWGRSRLIVTYSDNVNQSIHYYVQTNATEAIANLGNFLTTSQWFSNSSDPFKRSPSVLSYDRSLNAHVTNDPRVWISGLSDEGGAGSWLAASVKQYVQPNQAELIKLEQFASEILDGSIQNANGSVKKSVFFYQPGAVAYNYPASVNWGNWWSWNEAAAFAIDRAYDYVHVTAAWWSLYRVARNYPSLLTTTWQTYLLKAFNTVATMTNARFAVGFVDDGLMGETVFRLLLDDLQRENWTANATALEGMMRSRQMIWSSERFPFGSEMAWDSTGQEGVYMWSQYFNDTATRTNTLNSILAYQPTLAHWGYNGNARRYWDNIYAGKLMRYERQIHHYGSGLNALPLLSEFMTSPTDYYLLRVGFGGISGPLSNIDAEGFASASFHSFADTLAWDAYSGDYGPNFVGHALGMTTFLVDHPDFGWQAFGGNILSRTPSVVVDIKDSVRRRVFIAPLGVLLILDAGAFSSVQWSGSNRQITVTIESTVNLSSSSVAKAPNGRLIIQKTASISNVGAIQPTMQLQSDGGAYVIPFVSGSATATAMFSVAN